MFENYWYIIGFDSDLKKNSMKTVKILDRHLLLLKNKDGELSLIEDRCCHRNVQLSLGSFDGETVTCSYHGWQYNCQGSCVNIPTTDKPIPKTATVKSYTIKVVNKIIWVFIGDQMKAADTPIPNMPELSNLYIHTDHIFNSDIKFVSESLFDPYHINYVHKNSIKSFMGDLNSKPIDFHITQTDHSLRGYYYRKNNGSFADKMYFGKNDQIKTEFEFIFPNISKLKIFFEKRTLIIYEHIVETEKDEISMIQLTAWENIFKPFPLFAKWFMKRISNTIVNEDIEFFKSYYKIYKNNPTKDVHVKSDEASIAFRKLWDTKETAHAKK